MFLDATDVCGDQGVMQKLVFNFRPDGFESENRPATRGLAARGPGSSSPRAAP